MKRLVPVLALLAAVTLSTGAEQALAQCGGVETYKARKNPNPGGRPPLAIGASVVLGAMPNLAERGYNVNARGCRQWSEGLRVLRNYKRHGRLPHLVVIALGENWIVTKDEIRTALRIIGPRRVLGIVVPRELGGGTSNDARVCRWAARFRKRVMVLDWPRYSRGHGEWFGPDGLHLTPSGAAALARLFAKALPYARAGEFPMGDRFPD